ncbi:MAG: plasmid mobilization relaxosome protein MobC [Bdellovibrionales bacterium]
MPKDRTESARKRPHRVNVRLSPEEWNKLCEHEKLLRWQKATILREAFVSGLPTNLMMDKEGERRFLTEFNRIGNNINQLAKHANTGELVSDARISEVRDDLKILYRFLMRFDGGR